MYATTAGVASDGYGYVSGADLWIRWNLFIPEPLIGAAPWPQPGMDVRAARLPPRTCWMGAWAYVPMYSAGLSMVMALAKIIGGQ